MNTILSEISQEERETPTVCSYTAKLQVGFTESTRVFTKDEEERGEGTAGLGEEAGYQVPESTQEEPALLLSSRVGGHSAQHVTVVFIIKLGSSPLTLRNDKC